MVHIHNRKELENFLLVATPLQRAIEHRLLEKSQHNKETTFFKEDIETLIMEQTEDMRHSVQAKYLARRRQFEESHKAGRDNSTIDEQLLKEFDQAWKNKAQRFLIVPGKETLSIINTYLRDKYDISITVALIISSFHREEIPNEMVDLMKRIDEFRKQVITDDMQRTNDSDEL